MIRLFIIAILFLSVACTEQVEEKPKMPEWTKKESVKLGEELAKEEEFNIRLYLAGNPGMDFKSTGSGLHYMIYDSVPDRKIPEVGDLVCIDMKISQLDGTLCYKTDDDECIQLIIDKSEAESGLQEGLKLMAEGERAKLIVPSHLAHGLVGDQDKIPPLTTLLIDVTIAELNAR